MNEPAKIEKVTDDALSRSIISSVIGIIVCMFCLVGTTWAWYSLSVESGDNDMAGANFDFSVAITESVGPDGNGIYTFEGGEHAVTLTKTGTATNGFCKVIATKTGEEGENTTYYAVDFSNMNSIGFTVTGHGTLKLIPMLGTPVESHDENLKDKAIGLASDTVAMMPPYEEIIQAEGQQQPPEKISDPEEEIVDEKIVESTKEQTETPTNPETAEPGTPTESEQEPPAEEQPTETTTPEPQE